MNVDIEQELSHDQWETLKALRMPPHRRPRLSSFVTDQLIALGLAFAVDGVAMISANGRRVLVRGSCRLLDLAA